MDYTQEDAIEAISEMVRKEADKTPEVILLTNKVCKRIEDNPHIDHAIHRVGVRAYVSQVAGQYQHMARNRYPEKPLPTAADFKPKPSRYARGDGNAQKAAAAIATSILDAYIVEGKRLGDCTRPDLRVAAAKARAAETGWRSKKKFFGLLLQRLDDDEILVREAVDSDEAVDLQAEADSQ